MISRSYDMLIKMMSRFLYSIEPVKEHFSVQNLATKYKLPLCITGLNFDAASCLHQELVDSMAGSKRLSTLTTTDHTSDTHTSQVDKLLKINQNWS